MNRRELLSGLLGLVPAAAVAANEVRMRRWRESAKEEAYNQANLNPERDATLKYIQALQGEWWDRKRARYKSKFFDNRLDNARRQDLALLTDTRPTIDISSPINGGQGKFARPDYLTEYTWNGLSPAMRRAMGVRTASGKHGERGSLCRAREGH